VGEVDADPGPGRKCLSSAACWAPAPQPRSTHDAPRQAEFVFEALEQALPHLAHYRGSAREAARTLVELALTVTQRAGSRTGPATASDGSTLPDSGVIGTRIRT